MDKKYSMLKCIENNVNELMKSTISLEVIGYNELTKPVFNNAKQKIAYDAKYEDVVCLISTSTFETGGSGILFTINDVYSKNWGGLDRAYKNSIFNSDLAKFGDSNIFYTNKMREVMAELAKIAGKEALLELGELAVRGAMAALEYFSKSSDKKIERNNAEIINKIETSLDDEIDELEYDDYVDVDEEQENAMYFYKEFIPLIDALWETIDYRDIDDLDIDELDVDTRKELELALNEILLALYFQTTKYLGEDLDDNENFDEFVSWLVFWGLMIFNGDKFRECYTVDDLQSAPDDWNNIINLVDYLGASEDWEDSFWYIFWKFSYTIFDIVEEFPEDNLTSLTAEESDSLHYKMEEWSSTFIDETRKLSDALDLATEYFIDRYPDSSE